MRKSGAACESKIKLPSPAQVVSCQIVNHDIILNFYKVIIESKLATAIIVRFSRSTKRDQAMFFFVLTDKDTNKEIFVHRPVVILLEVLWPFKAQAWIPCALLH